MLTVKTTNGRFEDISTNAQLLPLHIEGVNTEKKTRAFAFLFFLREGRQKTNRFHRAKRTRRTIKLTAAAAFDEALLQQQQQPAIFQRVGEKCHSK